MKGDIEVGTQEEVFTYAVTILIVILLLVAGGALIDAIFNKGHVVRTIICGLLFWLPLGSITQIITGGCAAIPV